MGLHKTVDNLTVAKRENESILMESNYEGNYDGFDPKSPEANIVFSLYQNAFLDQSLDFASNVQEQVHNKLKRFDRGIKQAGFLVLYKTAMPSVLIETGFLTNDNDEKFINTVDGQYNIASAIFDAFKNYKISMESVGISTPVTNKISNIDTSNNQAKENYTESNNDELKIDKKTPVQENTVTNEIQIVYRIQIASSSTKILPNSPELKGLKEVKEMKLNNLYKYYICEYAKFEDALNMQTKIRTNGIKDAFVVAFNNGKVISVAEAKKINTNQIN